MRTPRFVTAWRDTLAFLGGSAWKFGGLSVLSLLAGLADALTLVLVVKVGLAITQGAVSSEISLGPIQPGSLSIAALLVLAGLLVFTSLGLNSIANRLGAALTADALASIRRRVVGSFARANWDVKSKEKEGHLQELMSTHVNRVSMAVSAVSSGLGFFFSFLALLATALVIDPVVSLGIIIVMLLLFGGLQPLRRLSRRFAQKRANAGVAFTGGVAQAVSIAQEMTVFDVGEQVASRLGNLADAEVKPARRVVFLESFIPDVYQAAALLLVLGALSVVFVGGSTQLAKLGAVVLVLLRSASYLKSLQRVLVVLNNLAPYLDQLRDQLATYDQAVTNEGGRQVGHVVSLAFEQVSFEYKPGEPVLRDISFKVGQGEVIGIIGPSGSGKSTMMQLLLRLREPTSGTFLINGEPADVSSMPEWRRRIALVSQEPRLFDDTVTENIRFFRSWITDADVIRAAEMANIGDEILTWPDGYQTRVGARGGEVSGGQRQRLCIARALAGSPDLLFLDEPTSALDARSESLVQETLLGLKGNVTMFVIAHRMSTLSICDRLMVLGSGSLQGFGVASELVDSNPFYREALRLSQLH